MVEPAPSSLPESHRAAEVCYWFYILNVCFLLLLMYSWTLSVSKFNTYTTEKLWFWIAGGCSLFSYNVTAHSFLDEYILYVIIYKYSSDHIIPGVFASKLLSPCCRDRPCFLLVWRSNVTSACKFCRGGRQKVKQYCYSQLASRPPLKRYPVCHLLTSMWMQRLYF